MTPMHIYRTLTMTTPKMDISENVFVLHFNNVQREIYNQYGGKYTLAANTSLVDIKDITDGSNLRDEYVGAVADKIRYLHSGNSVDEENYYSKVTAAYLNVWREMSRNKYTKQRGKGTVVIDQTTTKEGE